MHKRTITGFTAVALAPALLALMSIAAVSEEPTGANALDIGSRRELFVDRYLIDRLFKATLKLHEPQLAPTMTEPADNLEDGTVILSGDGIHWRKLQPEPVVTYTKEYAFDSQNVSFWSESERCYVC